MYTLDEIDTQFTSKWTGSGNMKENKKFKRGTLLKRDFNIGVFL